MDNAIEIGQWHYCRQQKHGYENDVLIEVFYSGYTNKSYESKDKGCQDYGRDKENQPDTKSMSYVCHPDAANKCDEC